MSRARLCLTHAVLIGFSALTLLPFGFMVNNVFRTNTEGTHHVVSSGLFVLATTAHASNFSTLYAAYAIASVPLLVLFVYATRPFIRGVTSGAFKA